jgi:hypothetical protein
MPAVDIITIGAFFGLVAVVLVGLVALFAFAQAREIQRIRRWAQPFMRAEERHRRQAGRRDRP